MQPLNTPVRRLLAAAFLCLRFVTQATLPGSAQVEERRQNCDAPSFRIRAPSYSVGRREHDAANPPALFLQISVPVDAALDESAMVGLACRLGSEFLGERSIHALIFDDGIAARRLLLHYTDQRGYGAYLWHLRARYELDREKKQESIEFVLPEVKEDLLGVKRYRVLISRRRASSEDRQP